MIEHEEVIPYQNTILAQYLPTVVQTNFQYVILMKIQAASTKYVSEHVPTNEYGLSKSVVTVPCESNNAKTAVKTLISLDFYI